MGFSSLWERSLCTVYLEDLVLRFKVPVVMRWNLNKMKRFAEEEKKCKVKRKCWRFSGRLNASFHMYYISTTACFVQEPHSCDMLWKCFKIKNRRYKYCVLILDFTFKGKMQLKSPRHCSNLLRMTYPCIFWLRLSDFSPNWPNLDEVMLHGDIMFFMLFD